MVCEFIYIINVTGLKDQNELICYRLSKWAIVAVYEMRSVSESWILHIQILDEKNKEVLKAIRLKESDKNQQKLFSIRTVLYLCCI